MSRPLRIEFAGAVYHVTSRGDRREPIFGDDHDRATFLTLLAQAAERFQLQLLAYCLMGNHYHLVLQTRQPNLSRAMKHINGVFTQRFNRRYELTGHLFQGRFHAIVVDRDAYLLTVCRYVERNPVAAGLVETPEAWPWSSCRANLGLVPPPAWLDTDSLHAVLLGHPAGDDDDPAARSRAIARYASLLQLPSSGDLWAQGLRHQTFLGSEAFAARMLARVPDTQPPREAIPLPLPPSRKPQPRRADARAHALHRAYTQGGQTMRELSAAVGLSVSQVSRLIAQAERDVATCNT